MNRNTKVRKQAVYAIRCMSCGWVLHGKKQELQRALERVTHAEWFCKRTRREGQFDGMTNIALNS